jgi:hypothetical protein
VRRPDVRRAVARLRAPGSPWPLSAARLATARDGGGGRARLLLHHDGGWHELGPRGWQRVVVPGALEEVRLRLRTAAPA